RPRPPPPPPPVALYCSWSVVSASRNDLSACCSCSAMRSVDGTMLPAVHSLRIAAAAAAVATTTTTTTTNTTTAMTRIYSIYTYHRRTSSQSTPSPFAFHLFCVRLLRMWSATFEQSPTL
ncbi:unnamed protein product, partial [Ectocarpus sp. 4 AP-2014]